MFRGLLVVLMVLVFLPVAMADPPRDETAAEKEFKRLQIPKELIPQKSKILFLLRAEGVQKYVAVGGPGGTFLWSLRGPKAMLFDYATGEAAGTHSQGPVWEAKDGSKVLGEVLAKKEAPNHEAVDCLLLRAKENIGKGRFEKVTFITRADTWAGRPPKALPNEKDAMSEVRYQATYVFWGGDDLELKDGEANGLGKVR
jgi:hypothetical protein